ncbi:hypothetical protein XELAEV_18029712mg [Xenopus laevis]|uniref:Uncharacterized protein n=1 Tax=Xenopus laevis TaxID=8355 RepID=A0A974CRZ9_XENLA|nr:hypothetical protein XELAEV_18029712mg [Xenopus laevis]
MFDIVRGGCVFLRHIPFSPVELSIIQNHNTGFLFCYRKVILTPKPKEKLSPCLFSFSTVVNKIAILCKSSTN